MHPIALISAAAPLVLAQGGLVINPKNADDGTTGTASIPIDLSQLVNNRGFGMIPGDANFDGIHSGYPGKRVKRSCALPEDTYRNLSISYIYSLSIQLSICHQPTSPTLA